MRDDWKHDQFAESIVDKLLPYFLKAGDEALSRSKAGLKISIKSDNSPVTDGDLEVDKILREGIKKITPDIPIISEETVNLKIKNEENTFWLIDPIDGTKDYINNKEEYTLNAALIINKRPTIGIINAPAKNRLFYSYGTSCAFTIRNKIKITLNCVKKTETGKIFALSHSSKPDDEILKVFKKYGVNKFTKMSSSLKFCVIAEGEADFYTCGARAFEWDIAAGHAILIHAGGSFTNLDGNEILYGKADFKNPPLLVKRSKNLFI